MEVPKYRSLKDHVYDYIAQKIQDGTLLPNQKINEAEICKGCSYTHPMHITGQAAFFRIQVCMRIHYRSLGSI